MGFNLDKEWIWNLDLDLDLSGSGKENGIAHSAFGNNVISILRTVELVMNVSLNKTYSKCCVLTIINDECDGPNNTNVID